jgi:ribosomal protein L15
MDKYHPGYFGKVGMRYFHKTQQKFWKPIINVSDEPLAMRAKGWMNCGSDRFADRE